MDEQFKQEYLCKPFDVSVIITEIEDKIINDKRLLREDFLTFMNIKNQQFAKKDREIAELKSKLKEAHEVIKYSLDILSGPSHWEDYYLMPAIERLSEFLKNNEEKK